MARGTSERPCAGGRFVRKGPGGRPCDSKAATRWIRGGGRRRRGEPNGTARPDGRRPVPLFWDGWACVQPPQPGTEAELNLERCTLALETLSLVARAARLFLPSHTRSRSALRPTPPRAFASSSSTVPAAHACARLPERSSPPRSPRRRGSRNESHVIMSNAGLDEKSAATVFPPPFLPLAAPPGICSASLAGSAWVGDARKPLGSPWSGCPLPRRPRRCRATPPSSRSCRRRRCRNLVCLATGAP